MISTPKDKAQTSMEEFEDITMPSLGADMTEGTLTQWLVKEGEQVTSGDIIAVLETQKGAIDMEVYSSGTIAEILVEPVIEVPVGTVLARLTLAEPSKKVPKPTPIPVVTASETSAEIDEHIDVSEQVKVSDVKVTGVKASPIVRRLAKEQQLDLTGIQGSGPQGAILLTDLTVLLSTNTNTKTEKHKAADKAEQNMRSAIAVAMDKSKQEIPHFYLNLELDISAAQQWLQQQNQATQAVSWFYEVCVSVQQNRNTPPRNANQSQVIPIIENNDVSPENFSKIVSASFNHPSEKTGTR